MEDRHRLFSIILYKDTDTYNINNILKNIKGYRYYAYILHNKDLTKDLELKKSHYHIIIKTDNACTLDALSKKIGVPVNYIQFIRNERSYIRYLIHVDDEDKTQYSLNEIQCSRSYYSKVMKSFDDLETEEEIIEKIFIFIQEHNDLDYFTFYRLFVQWLNSNCYYSIYNRYRKEFSLVLNFSK